MASSNSAVKNWLKQFHAVHAAYKWLRMFTQVPVSDWMNSHRTSSILRVLPNTMLPAKRLISAYDTVTTVERERIPGAIVECGVWSGGGIGLMALASQKAGSSDRRFHLFDSFEGLPQPSPKDSEVAAGYMDSNPEASLDDGKGGSNLRAIGVCVGADASTVRRFLTQELRIPLERLTFHVGWFQDTVPAARAGIGPLAILRIDGDWYESTKVCMDNLFDAVVDNGFIIIDDYGTFTGCRHAVDEALAARGIPTSRLISVDGECVYMRK